MPCVAGESRARASSAAHVLIVNQQEVTQALTMRRAIGVMRETLVALEQGQAIQPLRMMMKLPADGAAFWIMPSYAGAPATLGVKVLTAFSGNAGTPYHTHQGAVLVFGDHGELLAVVDATSMTAIRTAAVSAVATDALARADSHVLAILGSGAQATSHVEAMTAVRQISDVRVWSRTAANAERFARDVAARHRIAVVACASVEEAVREADIVCTTTAAHAPILEGAWLRPGTHVNSVGSGSATDREVDGATVRMARVFVDRMESAMREAGDLLLAIEEGAVGAADFAGELGAVLAGHVIGRRTAGEITLFNSVGLGAEDVAAARATYDECVRLGLGREVAF
ncbi:MAG: ornithine cyclodeaminase family protein [bacterium]